MRIFKCYDQISSYCKKTFSKLMLFHARKCKNALAFSHKKYTHSNPMISKLMLFHARKCKNALAFSHKKYTHSNPMIRKLMLFHARKCKNALAFSHKKYAHSNPMIRYPFVMHPFITKLDNRVSPSQVYPRSEATGEKVVTECKLIVLA